MKVAIFAAAGLIAVAACATNAADDDPAPELVQPEADGGWPIVDGGTVDGNSPDVDWDAERPLACGDSGFCETRIPTSNLGVPTSLRSVWVVASNDVWSVSVEGLVLHYDGTSWTTAYEANHALYSVWATATDVWVGGEGGLLLRRHAGGEWTRVETAHVESIRAIYGNGDDDVWFMSRDDSVDHFDGTKLATHPIGLPGLRITTVFGRPGFGAYAAGYVKGPLTPSDMGTIEHEPHVFQLSATGISEFSAALTEKKGFVPLSGVVTDAPSEDQRIFMVGYLDYGFRLDVHCGRLGSGTPVAIDYLPGASTSNPSGGPAPVPPVSMWARNWDDVQIPYAVGRVFRWNGSGWETKVINMGYKFAPQTVFGIHGNATDTWVVGDGFALKGAAL